MSNWRETADEAITHNIADVLDNGPRLAWGSKTAPIAIDRKAKRVLETGLGCMGVGTMWIEYDDEPAEWADLPEQDSTGGTCGVCGRQSDIDGPPPTLTNVVVGTDAEGRTIVRPTLSTHIRHDPETGAVCWCQPKP